MQFTATQIAAMLGGNVEGNPDTIVSSLSKIEEGKPGTLTFLANPKYTEFIYATGASIAIVSDDFTPEKSLPPSLTLIRVKDAYGSFAKLLEAYNQLRKPKPGIDDKAAISASAKIGAGVYIGAFCYIGEGAVIGEGVYIYPNSYIGDGTRVGDHSVVYAGVRVYADCVIGNHCTLHSGVIIGGDGFGFSPNSENNYAKVPQIGNVIMEDHVEVGSNTTIDRATLGSTIIRRGVKLDNLIQIAHNVEIGENTVIAAQTGVAGSTRIGKNCMIGGQVGIVGHLNIADGTKIAAQSGVGHDIKEPNTIIQGSPAFAIMDYKKSYVGFRKLPELMQQLQELQKKNS
ncbi:MAG: UDP-3-O-(3-hydroxymyristoyl)glucosamine N-acyltransferase [Flavobacteriales bacterium]|nr:UDP-3-O-(3-hydroxymyristoyl)glucosamine N-acyltransferase [Flavobacteriales bacterium]